MNRFLRLDCKKASPGLLPCSTAKSVRVWYATHKWTSLICTAVLLVSCLTGLPLIFYEDLERLFDRSVVPASAVSGNRQGSLQDMVETARQRHPGQSVLSLYWDDDLPRVFAVVAPSPNPKPGEQRTLAFDARTAQLLEEPKPDRGFLYVMFTLHAELFAGLPGEVFLAVMALLFVAAIVSGAVVYGPFMRNLPFGAVRMGLSPRAKWFDMHNLLGIVTLTWALVIGVTGVLNSLATPLFALWRAQEMPHLLAPYRGKPSPARIASADTAVERARAALPDTEMLSVVLPNAYLGSPRHYVVWTKGKTPLTSRLFTPVLVDAGTGQLTGARPLPWYLRALEISRPLHFGDYGGMPLKVLWAALDIVTIVVLASGLYLWISRGKTRFEEELDQLVEFQAAQAGEVAR